MSTDNKTPWVPTHRHYKGGLYQMVGIGCMEADKSFAVAYIGEDGHMWVRPTDEEAKTSFIARKKRQAGILEARARRAREAILAVEGKLFVTVHLRDVVCAS